MDRAGNQSGISFSAPTKPPSSGIPALGQSVKVPKVLGHQKGPAMSFEDAQLFWARAYGGKLGEVYKRKYFS